MTNFHLACQLARSRDSSEIADRGRAYHAAWCERVFAPALTGREGVERARRLAEVIALTAVYVWKVLRRDRVLS